MPRIGWTPSLERDWPRSSGADPRAHLKLPDAVPDSGPPRVLSRHAANEAVAADLVRTTRGALTHEQARERVDRARERGDRERANGNR